MKQKGFKKFLVSLGIGVMLTFGLAASASAATGSELLKIECEESSVPMVIMDENVQEASYLGYTTQIVQTAATTTSISLKWNPVSGANVYGLQIAKYGTTDYNTYWVANPAANISNLKPGTSYNIRIWAGDQNTKEVSDRYSSLTCTTLYDKVTVKSTSYLGNNCTITMTPPTPLNAITGYRVSYKNYSTGKTTTKDYPAGYNHAFVLQSLKSNTFYYVTIKPYLTLNGQKFVSKTGATRYIALQPDLQKGGHTSTSMTVKWNKTAGATSYSIYIKYPGTSTFKKVKTTTGLSYTLSGMKKNTTYYIKIVTNKKVGSKTWTSGKNYYYSMRLTTY